MKYPQLVHMPRHVEDWLERELEARGIDGVVYTRYILSLLQQDSIDDLYDFSTCVSRSKGSWRSRKRGRRDTDSWHSWHGWHTWSNLDTESLKRLAAVRCLMSASGEKCDIETLVDELCVKLKEIHNGAGPLEIIPSAPAYAAQQVPASSCSPGDPASRYYAAFPALKGAVPEVSRAAVGAPWGPSTDVGRAGPDPNVGHPCTMEDDPPPLGLELQLELELTKSEVSDRGEVDRENLECLIAKFDPSMQAIWASGGLIGQPTKRDQVWSPPEPAPLPYKSSFPDWNQLSGGVWGVGLMDTMLDAVNETLSTMKKWSAAEEPVPVPVPEEEDLLTSTKTHFRPIPAEEHQAPQPAVYADGTTFAISNELEEVKFRRSESGILYLETDLEIDLETEPRKYMEYKEKMEEEVEEFVPKFRVRQSNEKCCQTEDMEEETCRPSSPSTASSPDLEDEFYFPGDTELIQNFINDSLDENKESRDADCNHNQLRGPWEGCGACNDAGRDQHRPYKQYKPYHQLYSVGRGAWEACGGRTGSPALEAQEATQTRRLRAELTEDGEELLSDLSCVTQIYSLYDDGPGTVSSGETTDNFHNERLRQLWGETPPHGRQAFIT